MSRCNAKNERIKRRYLCYLREGRGLAETTIDHARLAIAEFEQFNGWAEFKKFRESDAIAYRKALLNGPSKRSAKLSSRATVNTKLQQVEKFFRWLSHQEGFKKAIRLEEVECFGLSRRDKRIALHTSPKPTPSVEEVRRAILAMPSNTIVERRDRALMSLLLLTGCRVGSAISLKLKHVHPNGCGINHDAREVSVKGAKSFPSYFFPVGDDIREIFQGYVDLLRSQLGWGENDPLFPRTRQAVGAAHTFETVGVERAHWNTVDPAQRIWRAAFQKAGLSRYSPHSVRRSLVSLGERLCRNPEEFKAWSQNLGHEDVMTTFRSYGPVADLRQSEILRSLGRSPKSDVDVLDEVAALLAARGFARR